MLNFKEFPAYIKIKVVINAPRTEILEKMDDGTIKIRVAGIPEKDRANKELVKFFKKKYGLSATIISGQKERIKLVRLDERI